MQRTLWLHTLKVPVPLSCAIILSLEVVFEIDIVFLLSSGKELSENC